MRRIAIAACLSATIVSLATTIARAEIIYQWQDLNGDPAIPGGIATQVENIFKNGPDQPFSPYLPFDEDGFAYTDRTHQWNGPRFNSAGVLSTTPAEGDIVAGLPYYLIGGDYVSTRQTNRDNPDFELNVGVRHPGPIHAYLLVDNRVGDGVATDPASPGSAGNGAMAWVEADGWEVMNTGLSPNGQVDFVGMDEGATPSTWAERVSDPVLNAQGPGNSINSFFTVFHKEFQNLDQIELREQNVGGISMYGLVVSNAVPEPSALAMAGAAALLGLRRRMRRSKGPCP
jgi:hypothetical protein